MHIPYTEPTADASAFNCPLCGAYAEFTWSHLHVSSPRSGGVQNIGFKAAKCSRCHGWSLWVPHIKQSSSGTSVESFRMVHPPALTSPLPSQNMPESCKVDYLEARQVFPLSPRAAAALLRLCIQRLVGDLGESGGNINSDIASLVKKGLDARIQKALDIVRVTGNNAVHPGNMDLNDNPEVAGKLFKLTNMIVEEMITKPSELDDLYGSLPEGALKQIAERDGRKEP